MRILGIDPGLVATGFGVVERSGSALIHVVHGTVRPPRELAARGAPALPLPRARAGDRGAPPGRGGDRAGLRREQPLGGARCSDRRAAPLLAAVAAGGLPVSEYTPSQIKQGVAGSGAAPKLQVQAMVRRILALERAPADAADALAAAIRHAHEPRLAVLGVIGRRRALAPAPPLRGGGEARAVIARLEGVLREQSPTRVIVDVGGVGYAVQIPLSTFTELPDEGKLVALHVHTHAQRGRAPAVRLRHPRRAGGLRAAAAREPRRAAPGADRPLRDHARRAAGGDPRREDRDAARGPRRGHRSSPSGSCSSCATAWTSWRSRWTGRKPPGARGRAASDAAAREQTLSALVNLGYPRSAGRAGGRGGGVGGRRLGDARDPGARLSQEVGAMKEAAGERAQIAGAALPEESGFEERLRPRSLDEMIGQDRLRENLRVFVRAARERAETLDHMLFHGPPGLGKTSLAHVVAHEMSAPLRTTSGPAIERPGDLAALLSNLEAGRRALHRRDPPPAGRGRGDPLSRDGGLPARHPDRAGAGRPLDAARSAALHADRRDHARRAADLSAARPLRLGRAARVLPAGRPGADPAALGAGARHLAGRRCLQRARGALARHAARREPAAAPRARLRRGGRRPGHA